MKQLASLLLKAGKVKVVGLGIFKVRKVAAREGYNVNDGSRISVPSFNKVAFRPTKQLKDLIQDYEEGI